MPYDVAGGLTPISPGNAFLQSRDAALRNALAQQQAANQEQAQQFQQQRLMAADAESSRQNSDARLEIARKRAFYLAQNLAAAKSPDEFNSLADMAAQEPAIQALGITRDKITPQNVQTLLSQSRAQAGEAAPVQYTQQNGPRGAILQRDPVTGELKQVVGPDNSQPVAPTPGRYVPLSAAEIQAAGLPAGSSAQRDAQTGKIDVLSKRDNTGVLSQKDATTAKMKLNTVALARAQLVKVKEAFEEGRKGFNAFGPGQGLMPTQAGKKFDGRVDQMRSTLTALTRVPGVGSMSDYETKLDQAKFPTRGSFESVTADKIQNLDDMLSLIEHGYRDLLTGGQSEAPTAIPKSAGPSVSNW